MNGQAIIAVPYRGKKNKQRIKQELRVTYQGARIYTDGYNVICEYQVNTDRSVFATP